MDLQNPQNPTPGAPTPSGAPNPAPQQPGSKNMTMIIAGIIVIIAIIVGAYYFMQDNGNETAGTSQENSQTADSASGTSQEALTEQEWANGSVMEDGTKVFNLAGNNFAFVPNQIKVNKGDKVKVMLNAMDMPHDFVLEGYDNVRTRIIQPGQTDFIMFTADKAGTFDFYCSVGQHRANGMVGQLMVME